MKRLIIVLLAIPCVTLAIDPKPVLDALYAPRPGDMCSIGVFASTTNTCSDAYAYRDYGTYEEFWTAAKANDEHAVRKLLSGAYVVKLEAGTRVEILKPRGRIAGHPGPEAVYIRPDEGPGKNCYFWVERFKVMRKLGVVKVSTKPK